MTIALHKTRNQEAIQQLKETEKENIPSSPVNSRCSVPFSAVKMLQWRFPIKTRLNAKMTSEPSQWLCCDIDAGK